MDGIDEQDREDALKRLAMYRAMQETIPGLDAMYRLTHALIVSHAPDAPRVLIAGAGGGREIEEFLRAGFVGPITALDPSAANLDTARLVARSSDPSAKISFVAGTARDLPPGETFDAATSLLVMHHLKDDGAKRAYLESLRDRLVPGGMLVHADICFDERAAFEQLVPAYLAQARLVGASTEATRLERDAVPRLPIVSDERTRALFAEAGLTEPFEVFRTLWYRCWISTRAG